MHTNYYASGPELKSVITLYFNVVENIILPVKSDLVKLLLKVRGKVVNLFIASLWICDNQLLY